LYAALSFPPVYHFANGASDQSRTSSNEVSQVMRFAFSLQKPSRSLSACSYSSTVAFALAANSGGGGNVLSSCLISSLFGFSVLMYSYIPILSVMCISLGNILGMRLYI